MHQACCESQCEVGTWLKHTKHSKLLVMLQQIVHCCQRRLIWELYRALIWQIFPPRSSLLLFLAPKFCHISQLENQAFSVSYPKISRTVRGRIIHHCVLMGGFSPFKTAVNSGLSVFLNKIMTVHVWVQQQKTSSDNVLCRLLNNRLQTISKYWFAVKKLWMLLFQFNYLRLNLMCLLRSL